MDEVTWNLTLEEFVKRYVSEDTHIRVSSLTTYVSSNYLDCNIVYDGNAAAIRQGTIDSGIAMLRVLAIEPWLRDTLLIYCE